MFMRNCISVLEKQKKNAQEKKYFIELKSGLIFICFMEEAVWWKLLGFMPNANLEVQLTHPYPFFLSIIFPSDRRKIREKCKQITSRDIKSNNCQQ